MSGGLYLGMDGGGTKTAFLLMDEDGTPLVRHEAASSYYPQIGLDGLRNMLTSGIAALFAQADVSPERCRYAFFGIPAYGEDSHIKGALDSLPSAILGHDRYQCDNDMVCGWAGSLGCEDGINIVAGTGSIAYGQHQGRNARSGGWGELFSDEGSAYWIAIRGLNIFSRMSDGRLPKGPLHDLVRAHFGLNQDLDLSGFLADSRNATRDTIAGLSRIVSAAAEAGDKEANAVLVGAAQELAAIIEAVATGLGIASGSSVSVSYSGGVFQARERILQPLEARLGESAVRFALTEPRFDPAHGAALYARKLAGVAPG